MPHSFRVRPGKDGTLCVIEILGDHRSDGFPDVRVLLRDALAAIQQPCPQELSEVVRTSMLIERYISFWTCPAGEYEIDDDIGGMFVSPRLGDRVCRDIVDALKRSGQFRSL